MSFFNRYERGSPRGADLVLGEISLSGGGCGLLGRRRGGFLGVGHCSGVGKWIGRIKG